MDECESGHKEKDDPDINLNEYAIFNDFELYNFHTESAKGRGVVYFQCKRRLCGTQ